MDLVRSPGQNPREPGRNLSQPPADLRQPGRELWNRILAEYEVSDAAGLTILKLACQALDRAEGLRQRIDSDGEVIVARGGAIRAHPAIKEELNCRQFVVKSLQRLGLNFEPVRLVGRPPADNHWSGDD